jgi:alkanesulfonate monooxygenase SsuD/methylene tetrahydromethanopterin reductase-like flavin-dependent oxidoreductase (luciferase family)
VKRHISALKSSYCRGTIGACCRTGDLADNITDGRLLGFGRGLGKWNTRHARRYQSDRQLYREYADLIINARNRHIEGGAITQQPRRELRPRPERSFLGRIFGSAGSPESVRTVAELGMGVLIINPEPRPALGVDFETYEKVWAEKQPNRRLPRPLLSGTIFVDESGDRAREISAQHHRICFRAAVKNYGMAEEDFGTSKGNEYYRKMKIDPAKIDEMAEQMASTMPPAHPPRCCLVGKHSEEYWPARFLPALHFGPMPRDVAVKNLKLSQKNACRNSRAGRRKARSGGLWIPQPELNA